MHGHPKVGKHFNMDKRVHLNLPDSIGMTALDLATKHLVESTPSFYKTLTWFALKSAGAEKGESSIEDEHNRKTKPRSFRTLQRLGEHSFTGGDACCHRDICCRFHNGLAATTTLIPAKLPHRGPHPHLDTSRRFRSGSHSPEIGHPTVGTCACCNVVGLHNRCLPGGE
ncbi:hypothetical protein CK203_111431 [Vitis vinifera]|uniref:Uncharacterized protein n=1 Tax=Vitis vinifera TaxID=29760 RepID=A0A438CCP7_VITVI|nr:hypothetical protein CK203_111431 [Vitis vinifera]